MPSRAEACIETAALPAGLPATTGTAKWTVAPGASRATDDGDGEPVPIGPATRADGATDSASVPPTLLTATSIESDCPLTSRSGPEEETVNSAGACTSKPALPEPRTAAPETASVPAAST